MLALKKMVVMEVVGSSLRLMAVHKGLRQWELPASMTIEGFEQRDPLALGPEIADFYHRVRIHKSQTVIALPRSSVVLRYLQFPKAVLENLSNIIEYQLENYEPIDRTDLAYSYQLMDRGAASGKLEVLLAMARRGEIEHLQKLLATLGVEPRAILCSSLGLAHLVQGEANASRKNILVLRVGDEDAEILVFLKGNLRRALGFKLLSERRPSEQCAQEVERALAELRLEPKDLHNIFLTGSQSDEMLPELKTEMPSLEWRPLRAPVSLHPRLTPTQFHAVAAGLGTAMLSMTRTGLTTNLADHSKVVARPKWVWAPTFALCGVGMLMAGAMAVGPFVQQRRFLGNLNAEIKKLRPQVERVERLEAEKTEWQKKTGVLESLQGRDTRNLEALRELSELLPDTTWINEFSMRGDGIDISGFADNATALVPLIDQSPLFQDAALASGITRNQDGKEIFRIRVKFRY